MSMQQCHDQSAPNGGPSGRLFVRTYNLNRLTVRLYFVSAHSETLYSFGDDLSTLIV